MKRVLALALSLIMVFVLVACGEKPETNPPDDSQQGQTEQNKTKIVNASEEAWVSSTTNIAYIFFADGKYESYSLVDGVWETNGNGTYEITEDSLTIDSTAYSVSLTDDTLTFTVNNNDYAYTRTSPFDPGQSSANGLDENLILSDGQAWISEQYGVISGYVFNADGTYSYYATGTWTLQSSGTWSTSGNSLELDYQGVEPFTYVLDGNSLTLTNAFGDVYGPFTAQAIPSGN